MSESNDRLPLEALDPGKSDPGYWDRFHGLVMDQAADELQRRRLAGDMGIADVVFQWRKALVPVALMAATVAGIFVAGTAEPAAEFAPVALEEALWGDLEGDPIPAVLQPGEEVDQFALLASAGGF
jgi:hypothetical protein